MRGVLSGERDDPAGAFNSEAREVFVGELLRADPAFCVQNYAVGQDSRALDDRLAGNLARDPFDVGAVRPVYLGRIAHDGSSDSGFGNHTTWSRAGGSASIWPKTLARLRPNPIQALRQWIRLIHRQEESI